MTSSQRHTQPWILTQAEVWESIYTSLRTSLLDGARIAVPLGDKTYLLTDPSQVSQGALPSEIYVKLQNARRILDKNAINSLCFTLNLINPSDHFEAVGKAIYDEYPVPHHVKAEYATLSGIDRKAHKMSQKPQITRTIDAKYKQIDCREHYRPEEGDLVEYRTGSSLVKMRICDVLSYRPYDGAWLVTVYENEYEFFIQRKVIDDNAGQWVWSAFTEE